MPSLHCSVVHAEATVEEKVTWNYYELFQMVLQAQADALVKLGFKPIVKVSNNHTLYICHIWWILLNEKLHFKMHMTITKFQKSQRFCQFI